MSLGSRRLILAGLTLCVSSAAGWSQGARPVLVFAAASLQTALDQIARQYVSDTGRKVLISYAATSVLARQIEQGAPADLFISADQEWMDWAGQRRLIQQDTRRDLVGNRLVLIAQQDDPIILKIESGFKLVEAIGQSRLAIGDPQGVPAGKYAIAALTSLGIAEDVRPRLVAAENVRTALLLVARGETRLGIVYETDAKSEPRVKVVGVFPENSHLPITYPVALTAQARPEEAQDFFRYLVSPAAQSVFKSDGFAILR